MAGWLLLCVREFLMSCRNAAVPGKLFWSADVPHTLCLCGNRKSEARPGLPNMFCTGCQQGSLLSSKPKPPVRWPAGISMSSPGAQQFLSEDGPLIHCHSGGVGWGASILGLWVLHGENPTGPFSLCWSKPWSFKVCASPFPVEGRLAINRGTSASKWC